MDDYAWMQKAFVVTVHLILLLRVGKTKKKTNKRFPTVIIYCNISFNAILQ